jgi:hypothetical protein
MVYIKNCQENGSAIFTSAPRLLMGVMVENLGGTVIMESSSNISSTKTERKIIEKNRRNQMKTLYSKLNSLLPNQNFKVLSLTISKDMSTCIIAC